jgi:TetR/AcrR family transcriptional regulator, fatty acid biosynthesis regulator
MLQTERPLSRQEAKLVTRQRLLQAAQEVLIEEGREGLTTCSVTKRIGVAQPTFYVHFPDMDELLRELAHGIVDRLRASLRQARAPMREHLADPVEASREAFRLSLRAAVQHAGLLRIFLAEQYRPQSLLGASARHLLDALADDMVNDAIDQPFAAGLKPGQLRLVADAVIALIMQMSQSLADGRVKDEEMVVDLLARTTMALVASFPR